MTDPTPEQAVPFGYECYDCGEVYPPGTDTTPGRSRATMPVPSRRAYCHRST
mgnify:CR=1 FL=1